MYSIYVFCSTGKRLRLSGNAQLSASDKWRASIKPCEKVLGWASYEDRRASLTLPEMGCKGRGDKCWGAGHTHFIKKQQPRYAETRNRSKGLAGLYPYTLPNELFGDSLQDSMKKTWSHGSQKPRIHLLRGCEDSSEEQQWRQLGGGKPRCRQPGRGSRTEGKVDRGHSWGSSQPPVPPAAPLWAELWQQRRAAPRAWSPGGGEVAAIKALHKA